MRVYKRAKSDYIKRPDAQASVIDQFNSYDNLLNFLPPAVFYGQRPSVWWTPRHDIDLIIGTYRYGYASYAQMRKDPDLSFQQTDQVGWQFQEYPQADNITRRLKKLVQIFGKPDYQFEIQFELPQTQHEPSGFTQQEKQFLTNMLINFGLPTTGDGKNDFQQIRQRMLGTGEHSSD